MSTVVPRTCTVLPSGVAGDATGAGLISGVAGDAAGAGTLTSDAFLEGTDDWLFAGDAAGAGPPGGAGLPLRKFRRLPAFVLLGDPGAGKTTEFRQECEALGETAAEYVRASDFIGLYRDADLDSLRSRWNDKALFIDGLDEIRAGRGDLRGPLNEIRSLLYRLGRQRFRISCREADWLGTNDRQNLAAVSPDAEIAVLRLDPLSEQSALELLKSQPGVPDASVFSIKARRLGLGAMLGNPLALKLLASAVSRNGEWPETRLETFANACREMAAETNEEHLAGARVKSTRTIMDAVGYLCSLLLLSGRDGYSLPSTRAKPAAVALSELDEPPGRLSLDDLEHALRTKLFTASSEGVFTPMHRLVAEFLAGRYLAEAIEGGPAAACRRLSDGRGLPAGNGLPARRAIALMTSTADGRVVTPLRGVSAWLAAHSREARQLLSESDPVGVGLYGDISVFNAHEKRRLLESLAEFAGESLLRRQYSQDGLFRNTNPYDMAWAFRSLAATDMASTICELLSGTSAERTDDQLQDLVLGTLSCAEDPKSLHALAEPLESILWDASRSPWIRQQALDAYLHIVSSHIVSPDDEPSWRARCRARRGSRVFHAASPGAEYAEVLESLLDASQDGSMPDPDDEIRGTLLEFLYPEVIAPSQVWCYALPRNNHFSGRFYIFWAWAILEKSSDRDMEELLDSLCGNTHRSVIVRDCTARDCTARDYPSLDRFHLDTLPSELLAHCLETNGDEYTTERLCKWLTVVSATGHYNLSSRQSLSTRIREWLTARPQLQKDIFLTWLRRSPQDDPTDRVWDWQHQILHGSALPPDFGTWCVDRARQLGDSEPEVVDELLRQAFQHFRQQSQSYGQAFDAMRGQLRGYPTLLQHLDEYERRLRSGASHHDEYRKEVQEIRRRNKEKQRQESEEWERYLREHETELRENRFSPENLDTLARVYLNTGAGPNQRRSPEEHLSALIGGDTRLVDAVMAALRDAASRGDIPEADQTISLLLESKRSWLAYPVLASLGLLDEADPKRLDALRETQKRRVLATYYCFGSGGGIPAWHDRWLDQDPELVLDVLYKCAVAAVRAGKEYPPGLNELDSVQGCDDRVHEVRLGLLQAFPVRSSSQQNYLLDSLLITALDHPDKASLAALAERKQGLKSMPIAQRIRWWATDALITQSGRMRQLQTELTKNEVRIRHLQQFLSRVWYRQDRRGSVLTTIEDTATLQAMIEILGSQCRPRLDSNETEMVTSEITLEDAIGRLIRQLVSVPDDEARQALASLLDNPQLEGWHRHLATAQKDREAMHRDACYTHPGVRQVQATLNGGPPANAADLRALLVDGLDDMRADLRGGNSDPWRPFWNENPDRSPVEPKSENSCRDALLTNLQLRLHSYNVDATREGSYAADARADIRVSCGRFSVPI